MKYRLKYLAPGLMLIAFHVIAWAVGAPASHASALVLSIGVLLLLNLLFSSHRCEEKLREEIADSLQREADLYDRIRKIFNAQTATIARLQARLYRRSR